MRTTLPLAGGRHVDKAMQINNQQAVNWYPENETPGAKSSVVMKPTPGYVLSTTQGNGPCRSHMVEFQNKMYWVSGAQVFSLDSAGTVTHVGTLLTTSGWCVLAAGRDYLMIVDGTDGWTWNATAFAKITDADFPTNPTWCAYIDGYFLANDSGTDRFHVSDLTAGAENPTSWSALSFATAEADPDDAVAISKTFERIYIVGTRTTQIYINSGNPDFPFELLSNGVLEWGTESAPSIDVAEGVLFMLARTTAGGLDVIMASGFQARSLATPDLIAAFDGFTTSNAEGFAYQQGKNTFYVLTFPTDDRTFVCHIETGEWHERKSKGIGRLRMRGHGFFNRRHYVGDYESGRLYYIDPDVYTENGVQILRKRVTVVVHLDGRDIECNRLEIEFKRGVGLVTGQGEDPQVMLRYSVDGGRTWSSELWQPLGKIGEYHMRAVWQQFGQGRSFMFEITVSDPVETVMIAAYADLEILAA